jgi:hypothetical protein
MRSETPASEFTWRWQFHGADYAYAMQYSAHRHFTAPISDS